jgi:hypothetical protein
MPPAKILDLPAELHLEILLRIVITGFADVVDDERVKNYNMEDKVRNCIEPIYEWVEPWTRTCPDCSARPCASACHIDHIVQQFSQMAEASLKSYFAACSPARLLWGSSKPMILHRAAVENRKYLEPLVEEIRRDMIRARLRHIVWHFLDEEGPETPITERETGGQVIAFLLLFHFVEELWEKAGKATALRRFQLR